MYSIYPVMKNDSGARERGVPTLAPLTVNRQNSNLWWRSPHLGSSEV